jgi:murein DD-endopeptidase MepM/ murein hydrolase activator NlpD
MKWKLYYFSTQRLQYVEARWIKMKTTALALLLLAVFVGSWSMFDDSILPAFLRSQSKLESENFRLKKQLELLVARAQLFDRRLVELSHKGNEIRSKVELPPIDMSEQSVGIGGTSELVALTPGADIDRVVNGLNQTVARLERELSLQRVSYDEALGQYEENKKKFTHMPALKPIEGSFSMDGFGWRKHPVYGVWMNHEGIDMNADAGTPIYAPGDGVVRVSGRYESGYGIMMIIEHGFGYTTLYGHLSKPFAREGQTVKRGDLIAYSGNTGVSSGPHLHYEVWVNGVRKNPVDFFFDDLTQKHYMQLLASSDKEHK